MAQLLAHLLTRGNENQRFRLESYKQFRSEFMEDQDLRNISKKYYGEDEAELTQEEIERYLDFFEDIGLYVNLGILSISI